MSFGFGQKNVALGPFMDAHTHEHKVSKKNEGEIPLLTRHNNSEGRIYRHFLLLVFNKRWHAALVLTCSRRD